MFLAPAMSHQALLATTSGSVAYEWDYPLSNSVRVGLLRMLSSGLQLSMLSCGLTALQLSMLSSGLTSTTTRD